jgi:universal stress protein E
MQDPKTILAVVDPTAQRQPAVTRAAWLARALGAGIELFICDYDPHLAGTRFFDSDAMHALRDRKLERHRAQLAVLAEPLTNEGFNVACDVRWAQPLDQGIVDKATETSPVLIVKDTHFHPPIRRTVFSNTDWNLIRHCRCPVMLVKARSIAPQPIVLAAVDPTHAHDRRNELDREILSLAKELASAVHGRLHACHAFDPAPVIASASHAMAAPVAAPVSELVATVRQQHRDAFDALLAAYPVDRDRRHFVEDSPERALLDLATDLPADIVVMGAVARGALKRLLLGSTAERVLDRLPCDLLIVKAL